MKPRELLLTVAAAAGLLATLTGFAAAQQPPGHAAAEIPELPPITKLSATVERPLFMRSRRPPAAPAAPVAEAAPIIVPSEEAPADLTGIVSGPDRIYAILTSHSTKEIHYLHKGETIDDWSVQEIGPRYVVLRRGPGSLRLELFEEKKPDAAAPGNRGHQPTQVMRPRFVPQARPYRPPQQRQPQRQRPRPARQPNRNRGDG